MAYPSDVEQQVISIGRVIDWWGNPPDLTATVTPILGGVKQLTHIATAGVMVARSTEFKGDAPGVLTFSVPKVLPERWADGTGAVARPWGYRVTVKRKWPGGGVDEVSREFSPDPAQEMIDLETIPEGQISTAVFGPVPAVTSVNGQTGAVVIEGGGGSVDLSGYATVEDLEPLARSSDVTQGLAGKADADHTHTEYATTTALSTGLAGKVNTSTHTALADRVTALEDADPAPQPTGVVLVEDPENPGALKFEVVSA